MEASFNARTGAPAATRARGVSTSLLTAASQHVADHVAEALAGTDVTTEQWRVLHYLSEHGGCTMSEVAGGASLNVSTLTRVVDRLVTSALAYRNVDPGDRRRVVVHLSARGRTLVRRLRPLVVSAEAQAVAPLSPAERDEFERALRRLVPDV